jgi:hypothetical protein
MYRTHRPFELVVRGARWGLPWIGALAFSAGVAAAMTVAVAGALAPVPESPRTNVLIAPNAATAALADGDDVRARFLASLSVRDSGPIQFDPAAQTCDASSGRLLYVGLNNWIPAEPRAASCTDAGR